MKEGNKGWIIDDRLFHYKNSVIILFDSINNILKRACFIHDCFVKIDLYIAGYTIDNERSSSQGFRWRFWVKRGKE